MLVYKDLRSYLLSLTGTIFSLEILLESYWYSLQNFRKIIHGVRYFLGAVDAKSLFPFFVVKKI